VHGSIKSFFSHSRRHANLSYHAYHAYHDLHIRETTGYKLYTQGKETDKEGWWGRRREEDNNDSDSNNDSDRKGSRVYTKQHIRPGKNTYFLHSADRASTILWPSAVIKTITGLFCT
jgi:hypothetical protein